MIAVSGLSVYPVKSCAGISRQSLSFDDIGPLDDRRWMIVRENGEFLTQRQLPKLALLQASPQGSGLMLEWQSRFCAVAEPGDRGDALAVQVWNDTVLALDAGDVVADWLSRQLDTPCRLVQMPPGTKRHVDPDYATRGELVSFADGFPLLLISEASLDDLNSRLENPVPMDRFRPNIVVSGCEPFAEDAWRHIRIGELDMQLAKACSRCTVPSIDQQTGERNGEILQVLASYRRRDRQTYFGQNLLHNEPGTISLGEEVIVLG